MRILVATLALVAICTAAPLPQDTGATGTWQKLQKLRTVASVMHTTAHPDDEHGGLLAMLSRGEGARVSLLTLTRGEAGDNAVGSELFDALGLIRTEELLRADQYYGVDQQYFTSVIDYGFSKRLEEALVKWGRENVLRDVVAIVRIERPLVLIARFQGNERDGHGNHQAAGLITQEAYKVAGDPTVFPEQIREGLRPWQPLKLYMGGVREDEDWTIRVDTNAYSPWLGDTYANFARIGLSFQRSQNAGRIDRINGPAYAYYKRLASRVEAPAKESSFFDGIDTRPDWFEPIARDADEAIRMFTMQDPSRAAPALARGLAHTRDAQVRHAADADVTRLLGIKEQQFVDAINAAVAVEFTATAQIDRPAVPGQSFDVRVHFATRGSVPVRAMLGDGVQRLSIPPNASFTKPYFERASLADNRYTIALEEFRHRPAVPPPLVTTAEYRVDNVPVRVTAPIVFREPQPPYGVVTRELAIVPALAVNVSPRQAIVPLAAASRQVPIDVELANNAANGSRGQLTLKLPAGWRSEPAAIAFAFARAGEKSKHSFVVTAPPIDTRDYSLDAIATVDGHEFREGYDTIEKRDLETRYLYHASTTRVRGVDVKIAPGLKVGYVMGVGDDVPSGIAQLGVDVHLLTAQDLASADLGRFNAIVTGTRAYGVREDLKTYKNRLLEYVENGGNLIVLYNTPQEFDPNQFAPFPARLPRDAEEVSEEDSPVEILAPARTEFTTPNRITTADFDGWIEQRGSKFFSSWDPAYTPLIATHDQGQAPQRGGWLTAMYGKGQYTYFAYALHRQLPYGVPGAYRLLANLLSLRP
jgi:LmbE family N-acetylglucosaminyl deacetylase